MTIQAELGRYSPSLPLRLALEHLSSKGEESSKAVILTPSLQRLQEALRQDEPNHGWIEEQWGREEWDRVEIRELRTLELWDTFFLAFVEPPTTTLIILHSLSSLLPNLASVQPYASVLSSLLSLDRFLSQPSTSTSKSNSQPDPGHAVTKFVIIDDVEGKNREAVPFHLREKREEVGVSLDLGDIVRWFLSDPL
ncbi:hypothetical protein BT69DRAFT_1280139, partial [Atractiella rhizophila]